MNPGCSSPATSAASSARLTCARRLSALIAKMCPGELSRRSDTEVMQPPPSALCHVLCYGVVTLGPIPPGAADQDRFQRRQLGGRAEQPRQPCCTTYYVQCYIDRIWSPRVGFARLRWVD